MTAQEKQREERKRDASWTPQQRWEAIAAAFAFAEENAPPRLRRNRPRTAPYARPLALKEKP
ncbi:MAG: hypothetical protein LBD30_04400 [Verrucomicrobiales bacterium]|jgi:hypothetical protein|nr:hypothetical protein [Verrucomicrobiales bacterium]